MRQETEATTIRDRFALKLLLSEKAELSEEEVEFFRQHPEDIDEITAPVNVHKLFLWFGTLLGIALVIGSKLIEVQTLFLIRHLHVKEVLVDIVFEIGVALIGGGVTAYLLGILLNTQQKRAVEWRRKIRNRINQPDKR